MISVSVSTDKTNNASKLPWLAQKYKGNSKQQKLFLYFNILLSAIISRFPVFVMGLNILNILFSFSVIFHPTGNCGEIWFQGLFVLWCGSKKKKEIKEKNMWKRKELQGKKNKWNTDFRICCFHWFKLNFKCFRFNWSTASSHCGIRATFLLISPLFFSFFFLTPLSCPNTLPSLCANYPLRGSKPHS